MDIGNLKKRIKVLKEEQASIDSQITFARQDIQNKINEHNNRINTMQAERNKLDGKIDVLSEFVVLEDSDSKKEKKEG